MKTLAFRLPSALIFVLAASFAPGPAFAQEPLTTFRPSLIESCSASHSYSGNSGYRHGRASGETSVNHFAASASARIALGKATFLGVGAAFAINEIDSDDSVPVPGRLGELTLNVGVTQMFSRQWRGSVFIRPGYYGDFESYTFGTLNAPLIALASYIPGKSTMWFFGMGVNPRGEYPVMPVVSFRWAFAEDWALNFGFPRLGVTWQATKALELGAGATVQGGGYRVTKAPGKPARANLADTQVNYREIRTGLRAAYKIASKTSISLEAGWMAERRFDYFDRDYELKGKSSAYIKTGVDVRL